jgi:hypothetical protein
MFNYLNFEFKYCLGFRILNLGFSRVAWLVTRRTETSKYPEEKKSNEIPLVSGERKGKSLNHNLLWCCRARHNVCEG